MALGNYFAQAAKQVQDAVKAAQAARKRDAQRAYFSQRGMRVMRNPFGAESGIDVWKTTTLSINGKNPPEAVKVWQTIIGVTPADGVFGPLTLAKTKSWQADHGIPQDGVVGPMTWGAAARTVVTGTGTEIVKQWQRVIGVEPVDGVFGPITHQKTKDWQAVHGITPDGIVGPLTWAAAGLSQLNPILSQAGITVQPVGTGVVPGVVTTPGVAQTSIPGTGVATSGKFEGTYAEAVKVWQKTIGVKDDGIFGVGTLSATKAFQQSKGITTDGIVGPLTWRAAGITREMPTLTAAKGVPAVPIPKPKPEESGFVATIAKKTGVDLKTGLGYAAGVGLLGFIAYKVFGKKRA